MNTRTKLTNTESIPNVVADLTLDEKLNIVGEYTACHTLEIPEMEIPSICLMDGVTGINGTQGLTDYITSPGMAEHPEEVQKLYMSIPELTELNYADIDAMRNKYKDNPYILELTDCFAKMRPEGKPHISFPSGINIGASFDSDNARQIGEAVGWEMRGVGVDIVLGPNVDISRDPLGGRGYEMYGEDPCLVEQMAAEFIEGVQSTGTGACAKHFLANNQETNRNTKDTHVSERTLREIYSRGFMAAVKRANVKSVMTAYNAINGQFTSYNKELLTGWIREEWGYEGLICCDWGAVKDEKEKALDVGMELILCGPNDMGECRKAIAQGIFSETTLDERVKRVLKTIVELRDEQAAKPFSYNQQELLETACKAVIDGCVLLKNERNILPLSKESTIAVYGKRSKELLECGTGSTAVITSLHSNIYEECGKSFDSVLYEKMEGADTLIYTAAALAGENIDRREMNIEKNDQERLPGILREAKERGMKTVVVLNIAGPVDMRDWIEYADSILTIFVPGCMGGVAAAKVLCGEAYPGGKLPVTFPRCYEDTPSYPNFPGEYNDVYYGEGIFVGYRNYQKRKLKVLFPFGYGLSYTSFQTEVKGESFKLDSSCQEVVEIPVTVKNVGNREGSEVIQIYSAEVKPHILRPEKELVGFKKVVLKPGESQMIKIRIMKDALRYFDQKKNAWILPVGEHKLWIGTSCEDIFKEVNLEILGKNEYALSGESTIGEILESPQAVKLVDEYTGGMISGNSEENLAFIVNNKLSDMLGMTMISRIPDAVRLNDMLEELYDKLRNL